MADDYYSFSRAPAFAARMRAALAAAPATAWATDLPITTCVALLAALDECMLSGGSALYEEKFRGRFAISEAAAAIQSRVVAAVDACPREGISPAHDSGLSREFLHEWSDAALHLYKHVYWAAWLTAETWSALLAALGGCSPLVLRSTLFASKGFARVAMTQECVSEIVRGATPTFREYSERLLVAIVLGSDMMHATRAFADKIRPRLARLLGQEWSVEAVTELLYRPWSQFDALGIEAFLRRVEANLARVRAMSDESLIAYAQPRSVYRSEG